MRILHIGNTAGVAWKIAQAQNNLGHDAKVMDVYKTRMNYDHDYECYALFPNHFFISMLFPHNIFKKLSIAKNFDVLHFHSGLTLLQIDALISHYFYNKPIVVHYQGSETRLGYGMYHQRIIFKKIVGGPDLLKWHPDAYYIPNPMKLNKYIFTPGDTPRIIHMPTAREKKGTDLILKAVNELKNEGLKFDFVLLEKKPHGIAMQELSKSDILIDQIGNFSSDENNEPLGIPGTVSLEAMSFGKLAISTLSKNIQQHYKRCPIINSEASLQSLKDAIHYAVENIHGAEMRKRSVAGYNYIKENHDPINIAKKIDAVYADD